MINNDKWLEIEPYQLSKIQKKTYFFDKLKSLNVHHYKNCKEYKIIVNSLNLNLTKIKNLEDFPMLPVRLFKKYELTSAPKNSAMKQLVSSGTSGQDLSKIFLDKKTSTNQIKVLNKIIPYALGDKRLPMLIIDQNPKTLDRKIFNARAAAIYGFSIFGKNHSFILNDKNEIDYFILNNFLKEYGKSKFLIFGFTSIIYEFLVEKLISKKIVGNFVNGCLIHGGGWKKMEKKKINNKSFKKVLNDKLNLKECHNYYGLVEQAGSIFLESQKCGFFHTSAFSDILIRDKQFNVLKFKKKGLVQLFSLIPSSYPGHNILTEDVGEILGEDDCKCGLKGKYFIIHGRTKKAEVRGCSDVR